MNANARMDKFEARLDAQDSKLDRILALLGADEPAKVTAPAAPAEPVTEAKARLTKAQNRALAKRYAKTLTAARKAGGADGYAAKWAEIKGKELARLA